jgi:hypothetical protein
MIRAQARLVAIALAAVNAPGAASAAGVGFSTALLDQYLVVGQSPSAYSVGVAVSSGNELGAVNALPGSAPAVPSPGVSPTLGTFYDGNVAITSGTGWVNMQDVDVYADIGIDCAPPYSFCTNSGSFFSNTDYDDAAGGAGLRAISQGDGINGSVGLGALVTEIDDARDALAALGTFDGLISTSSGVISSNQVVNLSAGVNIIGFSGVGSNDISLNNASLIFQGPAGAKAIVLVPDGSNFKVSNGNLVIGNGGIGLNDVVIVSLTADTDTHFDLSNSILNGVALWDLGEADDGIYGQVVFNNVGGCTQVVGDKVNFNDVNLSRCGFAAAVVPVPPAIWLLGSAVGLLGWMRQRRSAV